MPILDVSDLEKDHLLREYILPYHSHVWSSTQTLWRNAMNRLESARLAYWLQRSGHIRSSRYFHLIRTRWTNTHCQRFLARMKQRCAVHLSFCNGNLSFVATWWIHFCVTFHFHESSRTIFESGIPVWTWSRAGYFFRLLVIVVAQPFAPIIPVLGNTWKLGVN